jgi:hypothetical protein
MRKLVIAVIVFSFLGFGPLKSFFQSESSKTGLPIIQTLKESKGIVQDGDKAKVYLAAEEKSNTSKQTALLLKYDSKNKKLMVGNVILPPIGNKENLNSLKKTVEKNYGVTVDHVFSFNEEGIAHILDMLAPNGIRLVNESETVKGREFLALIDQYSSTQNNQQDLKGLFISLKKEIQNKNNAENWISLAPAVMNEAYKNVNSDLNKAELLTLGITALLNPITTIEPIKFKASDEAVNSQLNEGQSQPLYN